MTGIRIFKVSYRWYEGDNEETLPGKAVTVEEFEADLVAINAKHISNHLQVGQKVICKICDKDIETIYKEEGGSYGEG